MYACVLNGYTKDPYVLSWRQDGVFTIAWYALTLGEFVNGNTSSEARTWLEQVGACLHNISVWWQQNRLQQSGNAKDRSMTWSALESRFRTVISVLCSNWVIADGQSEPCTFHHLLVETVFRMIDYCRSRYNTVS